MRIINNNCHIPLTMATSHPIISPLIKTVVKFIILRGNFAGCIKQISDIGYVR